MADAAERLIAARTHVVRWCAAWRTAVTFRVGESDGTWSNLRKGLVCKCGLNVRICLIYLALEDVSPAQGILLLVRSTPLFRVVVQRFPQVKGREYLGPQLTPGEFVQLGRPGGVLMATCPFFDLERHVVPCEVIDGVLRHQRPPGYHRNPVSAAGSLVYMRHGWPLIDDVRGAGFGQVEIGLCYDAIQGNVSNANPHPEGHNLAGRVPRDQGGPLSARGPAGRARPHAPAASASAAVMPEVGLRACE